MSNETTEKHTGGEWTFLPRPMSKTVGSEPQYVITGNDGRALETVAIAYGLSNARLIAAAPELLALAERADRLLGASTNPEALEIAALARAAIAKATQA